MNIPEEAIEAAAEAFFGTLAPSKWEDQGPLTQGAYRDKARAALEAATPHMLADAWDEGLKRGAVGAYIHPAEYATNPYRSQP